MPDHRALRPILARLNDAVTPLARSPLTGPPPIGTGLTVLETVGRRTGILRERPVLSARLGDWMVAGTVRRRSDWIANLRAAPRMGVWVDGERVPAEATVVRSPVGWIAKIHLDD